MTNPHSRIATVTMLALALLLAGVPAAGAAERVKAAVVALGLWSDPVFASEAAGAAKVVSARFGHGAPVIVRANTSRSMAAGPDAMIKALDAVRRGLDPERDVLFLVLTSHGSPDGIVEKGAGQVGLLAPDQLGAILAKSPFRRKVLVVSACFSGIYTALADADTLVITAADATHPSFGCVPEARIGPISATPFSIRRCGGPPRVRQAFADARTSSWRPARARRGYAPSNPQIAGGENVIEALSPGQ